MNVQNDSADISACVWRVCYMMCHNILCIILCNTLSITCHVVAYSPEVGSTLAFSSRIPTAMHVLTCAHLLAQPDTSLAKGNGLLRCRPEHQGAEERWDAAAAALCPDRRPAAEGGELQGLSIALYIYHVLYIIHTCTHLAYRIINMI